MIVFFLFLLNVLVFLVSLGDTESFFRLFSLYHFSSDGFHFHQFITHMFLHGDLLHIIYNMIALLEFGPKVEGKLGSRRFFWFYMICGVGAALCQQIAQYCGFKLFGMTPLRAVGASGALFGIIVAFCIMFPFEEISVRISDQQVKVPASLAGIIYAITEVLSFGSGDGIGHSAHLGGMIFGVVLIVYWGSAEEKEEQTIPLGYDLSAFRNLSERRRMECSHTADVFRVDGEQTTALSSGCHPTDDSRDPDSNSILRMRAKLFRYDTDEKEWKERCVGDVVLKEDEQHLIRIIMYQERTFVPHLDHYVRPEIELKAMNDRSWMWMTPLDFSEEEPRPAIFALRFKNKTGLSHVSYPFFIVECFLK